MLGNKFYFFLNLFGTPLYVPKTKKNSIIVFVDEYAPQLKKIP